MSAALEMRMGVAAPAAALPALPLPVPWRDPHTVPKDLLRSHISTLEMQVAENPKSADLWTCLGMAYAMDLRVHPSMNALETAKDLAPGHFWAQFKYAELNYRLRALEVAEAETLKALELASNTVEYGVSRRQLQEIRRLRREGTQKPAWTKPLPAPALALVLALILSVLGVTLR